MHDLKQMAQMLSSEIDSYCVDLYDDGHREHLGASVLGDPCSRKLWYMFRWVSHNTYTANLYRLWNRGHLEEARIIAWLRGVGIKIDEYHPDSCLIYHEGSDDYLVMTKAECDVALKEPSVDDVTGSQYHQKRALERGVKRKQLRVSFCGGHAGGSCDGIGWLPERYNYTHPILLEFKTANKSSFNQLVKEGLRSNKPNHYAQVNIYGRDVLDEPIRLGLYICVCKDNDQIYYEFVELNSAVADSYEQKAYGIVNASTPPPRVSNMAGSYTCRFCDFNKLCHFDLPYDKNCRSCKHATPYDNKVWFCGKHQIQLDSNTIAAGCDSHEDAR